jgi:ribonuclease J
MITIHAIGGYSQIGKNMTAVQWKDEIVILDCGYWMEKVIGLENGNAADLDLNDLYKLGIVADDKEFRRQYGKMVKAIVPSHAHLDHLGAIPSMAANYKGVPIVATPFTIEVLNNLIKDKENKIGNKLVKLNAGSSFQASKNIRVEFIYATHSTLQTVMVAIHTPDGVILYANDWKFDEYPTLGKRTDYDALRKLAPVKVLISDTTRIGRESKTHSESIVKDMLRDVLLWTENKNNLVVITTFASHLARINMIVDFAHEMKRKPIIMGRSLSNYIEAGEKCGLIDISGKATVTGWKHQMMKNLKKIQKNRGDYLLIVTGNQGEPNAVLSRMATHELPFEFQKDDQVIFCSEVIPAPINMANRAHLEKQLKNRQVRIFKDIHVSGHASREDHRDLMNILKPKHYVPTHGGINKLAKAVELAMEMGYTLGKNAHLIQDGQTLNIK